MAFMQWFKCYADLKDHPKRWRFEELADTEYGLHYITAWFSYVCKFAPNGDVTAFTPREVARACEWKGDPQKFWDALVGSGFVDAVEGGFLAHDWHEENGRFIRENEKRKEPKGYPRVSQGLPTRQDKTGQDKTPASAGEGKAFTDWFYQKHLEAHGQKPSPAVWVFKKADVHAKALGVKELIRRAENYFADPYIKSHPLEDFIGAPDKWLARRVAVGDKVGERVQADRKRTAL